MPKLCFIRQVVAGPTSELVSIHLGQEQLTNRSATSLSTTA